MTTPEVSIIIPCLNEEQTITELLVAILQQTFPIEKLEVLISDGISVDQTRQRIADFQKSHAELKIRVLDNTTRTIPAGLNLAIRSAAGNIITRMDAHAIPSVDYVERSVTALKVGLGDNIGGVIDVRPGADTWIARGISVATAHPLGVGDAKYRWAIKAGEADTVAFGTFFRSKFQEIGLFNEELRANEDYEFNARLRAAGGKIWIDPAIRAVYYSRSTLLSLARQYFTYGFWKYRMLEKNPNTLRWRQALPPIFVLGVLMLLLLSGFITLARTLFIISLGSYFIILLAASSVVVVKRRDLTILVAIPLAILTMHFSWGSGFWWSLLNRKKQSL